MFKNKKILKQIEEERRKLNEEKEELLKLQEIMTYSYPKIDITYVYVCEENGIYHIGKLYEEKIRGRLYGGKGPMSDGFEATLVDIFNQNIIFKKGSKDRIGRKVCIFDDDTLRNCHYVYLIPICEIEPNLLAYLDKKVPLYILQKLYYKLNNIDINSSLFDKHKILQKINNKTK